MIFPVSDFLWSLKFWFPPYPFLSPPHIPSALHLLLFSFSPGWAKMGIILASSMPKGSMICRNACATSKSTLTFCCRKTRGHYSVLFLKWELMWICEDQWMNWPNIMATVSKWHEVLVCARFPPEFVVCFLCFLKLLSWQWLL